MLSQWNPTQPTDLGTQQSFDSFRAKPGPDRMARSGISRLFLPFALAVGFLALVILLSFGTLTKEFTGTLTISGVEQTGKLVLTCSQGDRFFGYSGMTGSLTLYDEEGNQVVYHSLDGTTHDDTYFDYCQFSESEIFYYTGNMKNVILEGTDYRFLSADEAFQELIAQARS